MEPAARFLCDEMLGRLCLYLRAAGIDAAFAQRGAADAALLRQCRNEGRYFLTQDAGIGEHKAAEGLAVILPHVPLDRLAFLVGDRFHIDWLACAFTRCLKDNALLVPADAKGLAKVPNDARRPGEPLRQCPACGRVYWRGSHYRRMRERLTSWQVTFTAC